MKFNELQHKIDKTLTPVSVGKYLPGCNSTAFVDLAMMIAAHESCFGKYRKQIKGPARGIFQMESPAWSDCEEYARKNKPALYHYMNGRFGLYRSHDMLAENDAYAIVIARIYFWKRPEKLPSKLDDMAQYAKDVWNTELGKATPEMYLNAYMDWKEGV